MPKDISWLGSITIQIVGKNPDCDTERRLKCTIGALFIAPCLPPGFISEGWYYKQTGFQMFYISGEKKKMLYIVGGNVN
jgi:hypothetical protein